MIRTFTFNPFIGLQIAMFMLMPFLILLIFTQVAYFKKENSNPSYFSHIIFRLIGGIYFGLLVVISIMLLDIALFWIMGAWTYADWRFQLPNVILIVLIALNFLGWSIFRKFTVLDLIYLFIVIIVIELFFHVIIPSIVVMSIVIEDWLAIVLILLILSYIPVNLLKFSNKLVIKVECTINQKRIFSPKFNFILWILATIQSILTLSGYSILG